MDKEIIIFVAGSLIAIVAVLFKKYIAAALMFLITVIAVAIIISANKGSFEKQGSVLPMSATLPAESASEPTPMPEPIAGKKEQPFNETFGAVSRNPIAPPILTAPEEQPKVDTSQINFTASGSCGNKVNWKFGKGILYIYGSGKMVNYNSVSKPSWYDKRNQIISAVIDEGVTYIGREAFADCVKLEHIEIPPSVAAIGSYAFYNCKSFKSFVIPGTVATIGASVFNGCTYLEDVFISNGVAEIDAHAFRDCISLERIILPESVSEIGYCSFRGCSKLSEAHILSKVISIGNLSFKDVSPDFTIYCYEGSTADTYGGDNKMNSIYYTEH